MTGETACTAGGSKLAALYDPSENFCGFDSTSESNHYLCDKTHLFKRYHTKVAKEWIDYNGHMTESRYLFVFGQGTDALLHHLGMHAEYVAKQKRSYYTVETHIQHLREIAEGEPISVETQLLKVDPKRIHFMHLMRKMNEPEQGILLATAEQMLLHVDTEKGRACVNENEDCNAKLAKIWDLHQEMEKPQGTARYVGAPRS